MLNSSILISIFALGLFFSFTHAMKWDWIEFVKFRKKMLNLLENDKCELLAQEQYVNHHEKDPNYYTHESREGLYELLYQRKAGDYECEHAITLAMMLPKEEMEPCVRGIRPRCRPFDDISIEGKKRKKGGGIRWRCSILHVRDHPVYHAQPAAENTDIWPVLDYCTELSKERDNNWNTANPHMKRLSAIMNVDDPNERVNKMNPANPAWPCGWPDGDPSKAWRPRPPPVPPIPRRRSSSSKSALDSSSAPKQTPRRRSSSLDRPSASNTPQKKLYSNKGRSYSMPPSVPATPRQRF